MLLGGPLGLLQALLMSPKARNASRDGIVNLNMFLNSIRFLRKPRTFNTRIVVLFLAYKTLSIDLNHLELAICMAAFWKKLEQHHVKKEKKTLISYLIGKRKFSKKPESLDQSGTYYVINNCDVKRGVSVTNPNAKGK